MTPEQIARCVGDIDYQAGVIMEDIPPPVDGETKRKTVAKIKSLYKNIETLLKSFDGPIVVPDDRYQNIKNIKNSVATYIEKIYVKHPSFMNSLEKVNDKLINLWASKSSTVPDVDELFRTPVIKEEGIKSLIDALLQCFKEWQEEGENSIDNIDATTMRRFKIFCEVLKDLTNIITLAAKVI